MPIWFLAALAAPFLFAIVNLIDDNLIRHVYKSAYFGAIISGLFGAIPLLLLIIKPIKQMSIAAAAAAIIAGFLTVIYYYFYFKALTYDSPSVVIAIYSLAPAFLPILAYFFLGERLQFMQLVGFTVILFASFMLSVIEIKRFKISPAFVPMILATLLFAFSTLLLKYTYKISSFYSGFMMFSLGMGLGGYFFLVISKYLHNGSFFLDLKKNSKKIISLFILAEIIALIAELILNIAIKYGEVSLVVVVSGVQPMYVLLIAILFYRKSPKHFREAAEGKIFKKLILMGVIVIGLVLVYFN